MSLTCPLASCKGLFISLFLHQTTTVARRADCVTGCLSLFSYIKPQPSGRCLCRCPGCLSLFSYIKPQLTRISKNSIGVVYLSFPTSNHNFAFVSCFWCKVVYLSFPTSNHNFNLKWTSSSPVVYLSFPTSNHNAILRAVFARALFISLFLHQTTTRYSLSIEK